MKKGILTGFALYLILISGCGYSLRSPIQFQPPRKPENDTSVREKLIESVPEKNQILAYVMTGNNWLFSVLILLAVGGAFLALGLKIKEGWALVLACIGGGGLIIAYSRWGWLIGLLVVGVSFILILSKVKILQDVGIFAVQYAEGLKKKLPADKVDEFNEAVFQPETIKNEIRKVRKK